MAGVLCDSEDEEVSTAIAAVVAAAAVAAVAASCLDSNITVSIGGGFAGCCREL